MAITYANTFDALSLFNSPPCLPPTFSISFRLISWHTTSSGTLSSDITKVNLCEWRKMLTQVDTSRCMKRGVTASEVLKAARKAGTEAGGGIGGDNNKNSSSSNGSGGSNFETSGVGKRLPLEVPMPAGTLKPAEEKAEF